MKKIISIAILIFSAIEITAQQGDILVRQGDKTFSLPKGIAMQSPLLRDAHKTLPGQAFMVPDWLPMVSLQKLMQSFEEHKNLSDKALLDAVEGDIRDIATPQLLKAADYLAFVPAINSIARHFANAVEKSLFSSELLKAVDYLAFTPGINVIARHFARNNPNINHLSEEFDQHSILIIAKYYYLLNERDLEGIDPQKIGFSFKEYTDYLLHVMKEIPDGILELSNKRIQSISSHDLRGFTWIKMLNLSSNQLTRLPPDVFHGLINLESLLLGKNQLTELHPSTFDGLINLEKLFLNKNKLIELHSETFKDLIKLKVLDLPKNQLKELNPVTFSGLIKLEMLGLKNNPLSIDTKRLLLREFGSKVIE